MTRQDEIARLLLHVHKTMTKVHRSNSRERNLTVQQSETLLTVAQNHSINVSDLAERLGITRATTSKNLNVLERMNLICRGNRKDGRETAVLLTEGGVVLTQKIGAGLMSMTGAIVEDMDREDILHILTALRKLVEVVGPA